MIIHTYIHTTDRSAGNISESELQTHLSNNVIKKKLLQSFSGYHWRDQQEDKIMPLQSNDLCFCCLKKNLNASVYDRPSRHPPVRGGQNVKTFRRLYDKTSSWQLNGFLDGSGIGSTEQYYNAGEKPTVILCTCYIDWSNRHAGTPNKTKQNNVVRVLSSHVF